MSSLKAKWAARIAYGGFFFFLIKGLVWVGIAAAAVVAGTR